MVVGLTTSCVASDAITRARSGWSDAAAPAVAVAVIGDFGTGGAGERAIAGEVRAWTAAVDADALVTTGDNVYPAGHPRQFEAAWTIPYGWVAEQDMPVIASLGNHDVKSAVGRHVMQLFDMPERRYLTSAGPVNFIVLDSNREWFDSQRRWLIRKLRAPDRGWRIAVFHHPPFSCAKHGNTRRVVESWVPLFERYGVDLVLNGHEHAYQRFARRGVSYIVTGGAGARLYEIEGCAPDTPRLRASDDDSHHFVTIEGDDERLVVTAIAADGSVLDSFELAAGGG
ncbi:MAG: metallophosphoesterase [Actinomycetota bacterium]|nr:metallophosphoesterase [Actinomycetota bacterium]